MRKWLRQWLGITAIEERLAAAPREALDQARIVAEWMDERARHPPGSPKHVAFTNRLREFGIGD